MGVKDKAIMLNVDVTLTNNETGEKRTGQFKCSDIVGIRFSTTDDDGVPCDIFLKTIINGDYTVTMMGVENGPI